MVSSPPRAVRPGAKQPIRRPVSARQRAIYRRRRIVAAVVAVLLLVGLGLGVRAIALSLFGGGDAAAAQPPADDQAVTMTLPTSGEPIALRPAGVNENNRIDPEPGEAVWYTGHDRVRPGELGTAVIVGHTEHDGEPDAFATLGDVEEGQRITIVFADGVTLELDVASVEVLTEDELRDSDTVWGEQSVTHRTVLVSSDLVEQGDREGHVVVVGQLG